MGLEIFDELSASHVMSCHRRDKGEQGESALLPSSYPKDRVRAGA